MKKTMLVLLAVLLLVPATLSAGILDLSLGATAQYNGSFAISENMEWQEGMADIENYAFGPDLRLRVLFAEVGVAGLYSTTATGHRIGGLVTGGLSLDFLGLLRVGLGLGPRMAVTFDEDWSNAQVIGPTGPVSGDTDLAAAFMNAPMTYRATVDLKLGKILFGLNYIIDSDGFTFQEANYDKLMPKFENGGTIGASLLFTLF
ncbi:MAG: hypothetical protein PHN93_04815 [Sphaerochaetaceae bacterium]|jgi:hypothetical protein|nr:hypothetical protein [Sphaerochaetaceae bacterium]MDX9938408.1 hypothetical protein [Sphaerochaetaceae bacterium]